ncbi:hypothetical protein Curi_c03930 [Gottschalkia acidurici 9a]|uniref:Lipoprotein n=1 Tax=Gottschalkia acidurici (strain ATCC 7906 / DSM 604 / BCRC 14475 / CIP 104303 / KCTC 5404 / NCIMB 10678 / 9a) TaxID=1128398 RepID=K0AUE9_GOTA9|nr:VCBS repeat-containing protein [Gottschalkia acidurici]AFS77468.1 hypothetical protein Curi_c03930 [Gottschalkia acidurici 9a]
MKKVLLALILILSLTGCNERQLNKAYEYLKAQEYKKAEDIFIKVSNDKDIQNSKKAYLGLIEIYDELDDIEKLKEVLEESTKKGLKYQDENTYNKIFDYYKSIGDEKTIRYLVEDGFSNIKLPIDIYREYIINDNIGNSEIIDIIVEDLNDDGKNEIAVALGNKGIEYNKDSYVQVNLKVFNNKSKVIYETDEPMSHEIADIHIELGDFTGDGKPELYYNRAHSSNFTINKIEILDFRNNKVKNIYDSDSVLLDLDISTISDNQLKIFSQDKRKSYILQTDWEMNIFDTEYQRFNMGEYKVVKDRIRNIAKLELPITLWGNGTYGKLLVTYEYKDGKVTYKDFKFTPEEGVKIVSSLSGKKYDSIEYGKNLLIRYWDMKKDDSEQGKIVLKVNENDMIFFTPNSGYVETQAYEVIECDEKNEIITVKKMIS